MPNLNKVQLMGNITRDPEVRYTPKGTAVTDIGLAINRNYSTDDGERREETTFVDITFWGRQAEVIGEYMKKGRPLYVEGRLQLDQWEHFSLVVDALIQAESTHLGSPHPTNERSRLAD
mgnify:CR=1 FL=1